MKRVCGLGLVGVALALTGCGVHPTVAELEAVPGASASYPGSVAVTGPGGIEGEHTLFANNPSTLSATYCTSGPAPGVVDWFSRRLRAAGWTAETNPPGIAGADVAQTFRWDRGSRRLVLTVMSTAYADRVSRARGRSCPMAFQTTVE